MPRYILNAGRLRLFGEETVEIWLGIESDLPLELGNIAREGIKLIPADGMTRDELAALGVHSFEPVDDFCTIH